MSSAHPRGFGAGGAVINKSIQPRVDDPAASSTYDGESDTRPCEDVLPRPPRQRLAFRAS